MFYFDLILEMFKCSRLKRFQGNQLGLVEHLLASIVAASAHDCPAHWLTGLANENRTAGTQICVSFDNQASA